MSIILLILGFVLAIKGADLLVTGGASLARKLHVSDLVIGLTVVAFGTSLPELSVNIAAKVGISESVIGATVVAVGTSVPELATSVVAAYRKNLDIAVGNVIGSNIFNIFFILGLSAMIKPLPVQSGDNIHIAAAIIRSVILFLCMFTGKRKILDRWEGALLVIGYLVYLYLVVSLG